MIMAARKPLVKTGSRVLDQHRADRHNGGPRSQKGGCRGGGAGWPGGGGDRRVGRDRYLLHTGDNVKLGPQILLRTMRNPMGS
jgi:hypothetical protein